MGAVNATKDAARHNDHLAKTSELIRRLLQERQRHRRRSDVHWASLWFVDRTYDFLVLPVVT